MRKIVLFISLLLVYGCISTTETVDIKNNIELNSLKTDPKIKIANARDDSIYFILDSSLKIDIDTPPENWDHAYLSTAKNYCKSLKKNTYMNYKPAAYGKNYWGGLDIQKHYSQYTLYDIVYEYRWGKNSYNVVRFFCADTKKEAISLAENYFYEYSQHQPLKYHLGKWSTIEYKRNIPPEEIAENKAKAEKERLAKIEKEKKLAEIARKQKLVSLELSYSEACTDGMFKKGFVKGTKEYEQCLFDKDREAIAKQKALDEKLAKMTPVQRREFNCENAFKFKPGTNEFNQCVFKLYTTELELEKLELQKQVALANERTAKAQMQAAASKQARANAVAKAQIAAAEAQKAAANSASLANSISLMQLGSSMLGGSSSSSSSSRGSFDINNRTRTTCRVVGGFLNCY